MLFECFLRARDIVDITVFGQALGPNAKSVLIWGAACQERLNLGLRNPK